MSAELIASITILVVSIFLGIELISRVPTLLHTPLMSGTNAIHGIVLIGGMLILGSADSTLEQTLAFIAVVFGTINIVGGFLVTDRMLDMFKRKKDEPGRGPSEQNVTLALSQNVVNLMYVVAAVGLILGIKGLSHPATARRGNLHRRGGDDRSRSPSRSRRPSHRHVLADHRRDRGRQR